MTPYQFAAVMRSQGERIVETDTCCWRMYRPFLFSSVPYHRSLQPSKSELDHVLFRGPSIALRFPTSIDQSRRRIGLFVCADRNYGLHSLDKKARNQTRRGLENCKIEQIEFAYLAKPGHRLNVESFERQGRSRHSITEDSWYRFCRMAGQTPDFEAWIASVKGRIAAFVVLALVENCLNIHYQSSATAFLSEYPNNALIFAVTKAKVDDPRISSVFYGAESLTTATLDCFKSHMGFELRKFGERIVFNPLLRTCLSVGGGSLVHWMARKHPRASMLRRASLVIRQEDASNSANLSSQAGIPSATSLLNAPEPQEKRALESIVEERLHARTK